MFWTMCGVTERCIRNPYELHRALWTLFPERDRRKFLFFVVERQTGRGAKLLVQSQQQPVIQVEGELTVLGPPKDLSSLQIATGRMLRFRLVANPTKKIKDKDNPERSIRVPYVVLEHQQAWLERKLAGCAQITEMDVSMMEPIYFRKREMHGKLQPVQFTGVLKVKDGRGLLEVIQAGIGAGKAFGLGLLQVAPL